MCFTKTYLSPIGLLTLAAEEDSLIGLWIENQKYFRDTVDEDLMPNDDLPVFRKAEDWLNAYFAGENPCTDTLKLAPRGNAFRQEVWQILREIPYGKVITYGEIASIIAERRGGEKMSARAVGGAVGHNPISIIIPCHRVVGSNGRLTGYSGGIELKEKLLRLEGVI